MKLINVKIFISTLYFHVMHVLTKKSITYIPTHRPDAPENLNFWNQKKGLQFQNLKLDL